jgi:putative endonuclease
VPIVYILRCGDGSLYTGAAKDLPRGLAQHAAGRASRYTRARLPVTLVWSRRVRTWSDALRTERRIKALRRVEKDALVRGATAAPLERRLDGRAPRPRRRPGGLWRPNLGRQVRRVRDFVGLHRSSSRAPRA